MAMKIIHPRPNPIVAAMYTLRDLNVDVIVVHGPAGCCFMASRMLEEAGVRVVTSGLMEDDLIFGGSDSLVETLKMSWEKFRPNTVAVIGTCSSMIIGEDMDASIRKAALPCNVFSVDSHGCSGDNTTGAVKALECACRAGLLSEGERDRQIYLMNAATSMEKRVGMAGREYLSPTRGPTKLAAAKRIADALGSGKKVACAMLAKKELAFRFADMFIALTEAKEKLGGELFLVGNLDGNLGLPRIRGYAEAIRSELDSKGVWYESVGGMDEYALIGRRIKERVDEFSPDLLIIIGIPHAYPELLPGNLLITDQPRQLANYLSMGLDAVGEVSSHSMVMGAKKIIPLETGETLRELLR
jgi:putative methanogenesis marker 13 metalloprotein